MYYFIYYSLFLYSVVVKWLIVIIMIKLQFWAKYKALYNKIKINKCLCKTSTYKTLKVQKK